MEFSEYLQLDRMAHWPRFLSHTVYTLLHSSSTCLLPPPHNTFKIKETTPNTIYDILS